MSKTRPKKKTCFVVGPIGEPETDTRIHADWLLEEIIEPVMNEFADFEVVRADKISRPGMIDAQVIQHLLGAELVIADLSMLNPNAFYEIGLRHMVQKPIIHMQRTDDEIPFDLTLYRASKFSRRRPVDLRQARKELKAAVESVLAEGYEVDNPVTRVRGRIRLEERASPEEKVLLDQVSGLQSRLARVEQALTRQLPNPDRGPRIEDRTVRIEIDEDKREAAREQIFDLLVKQFGSFQLLGEGSKGIAIAVNSIKHGQKGETCVWTPRN